MPNPESKFRILLLADPMANAKQWISGLEKYGSVEVINWHLHHKNKIMRTLEWLNALFSIKRQVRKINPDIIIGYRLTSYGFLAAWAGYKPCVLAAQGITDIWPVNHWTSYFKAFLAEYAISRADLIHAWGENMTDDIIKHGAKKEQLLVMPRGVDISIFSPPDNKEGNFENRVVRLTVTRSLYPEYGHLVILKAFQKLISNSYKVELNIAGSGPEQEKISNYIVTNNLQNYVHMLGHVPNNDLPQLLRETDLYISMPETEGISGSLFEAMSCGCFPILSDLPANRLIINDAETGYLVPVGDETALYNKIASVIDDPLLLKEAVRKNYSYVQKNANLRNNMEVFVRKYRNLVLNRLS